MTFLPCISFSVNNVGLGYQGPELLDEISADVSTFWKTSNQEYRERASILLHILLCKRVADN